MRFPRSSGVLLHPTSLPGPSGSGDFGPAAYHFVDWLVAAGQRLWQLLPLGGIGAGNSPYMSTSAFAGNVLLIDLGELQQRGWLKADDLVADPAFAEQRIVFDKVVPYRMARLARAAQGFAATATTAQREAFETFCEEQHDWLHDYALFMSLANQFEWADWSEWDSALRLRDASALRAAAQAQASHLQFWKFCQWSFFRQWRALKAYANQRGVEIIGDAPIFIACQSAEVWARQELFELDAHGRPQVVAGVPPDAFSATGQRWGNPLYRWDRMAGENFSWWTARVRRALAQTDGFRIDHFRGFAAYWEVPADCPTAMQGRWVPGPGAALFEALADALTEALTEASANPHGALPIVAEDLGIITPDVTALREACGFPGMRVMQFAFGGDADHAYLPHQFEPATVAYTGTHDNDTVQGWWHNAPPRERAFAGSYLAAGGDDIHWAMIRAVCNSVANTVVVPLQDVLGLDGSHRMNRPGSPTGNWAWRFDWAMVGAEPARVLGVIAAASGRGPLALLDLPGELG